MLPSPSRSLIAHVALQSLWFSMLLPAARADEIAARIPADAVAYASWKDIPSESGFWIRALRVVADSPLLKREEPGVAQKIAKVGDLLVALGRRGAAAVRETDDPNNYEFWVAFESGADSTAVREMLEELLDELDIDTSRMKVTQEGGVTIIQTGDAAAPSEFIALREEWRSLQQAAPKVDGWHIDAYVDTGRAVNLIGKSSGDDFIQIMSAIGANSFGHALMRMSDTPHGTGYVGVMSLPPADTLVGAMARQKSLDERDIALIPRNAYFGTVWKHDLSELLRDFRDVSGDINPDLPQMIEAGLGMAGGLLGFSIEHDLLAAFGDVWAIFDAPNHGGLFVTGVCLVAQTREPAAIEGALARVVQIIAPFARQVHVDLRPGEMSHDGRSVKYVLVGGYPVPIAPAWGIADGYAVFGLHPQTVARALEHVASRSKDNSILSHPSYSKVRADLPKHLTTFGYMDSSGGEAAWNGLRLLFHTALASLSPDSPHAFRIEEIPPFEPGRADPYFSGQGIEDDRLVWKEFGFSPSLMMGGSSMPVALAGLTASILLPSLSRARQVARRTVAATNLRTIGMACHIYSNDHAGRFPQSFDELLDNALVMPAVLKSPAHPDHVNVSYVMIPGHTIDSAPQLVLAYEKIADDEGTNVLFVDGHVEFTRLQFLEEYLYRTYIALQREYEPPQRAR